MQVQHQKSTPYTAWRTLNSLELRMDRDNTSQIATPSLVTFLLQAQRFWLRPDVLLAEANQKSDWLSGHPRRP